MAASVPSSAIRTVVGSMLRSVLQNVCEVHLETYLKCTLEHLESLPGSIESRRLRMCY